MVNLRIYVQESVVEVFIEVFKNKFQVVVVGDLMDEKINYGFQVDEI